MIPVHLPAVALTAAVTGKTAGVWAFFEVPRPPDNSPEVPLPVPPPPLEGPGDSDAIRSGWQLARFARRWSDAPSLPATTVRQGFHWTWASDPPALRFSSTTQRQPDLREPILDWVTKGVVVPVPDQPCFLSRLFAVPRPDNRPPRLIIDLSRMNYYIVAPPFSLDNHSTPVGRTVPHSTDGPGLAGVSSSHTSPTGVDGGSPQFCMPGALVPSPQRPAVDQEQHSGSSNGAGQTRPSPSVYAGRVEVLGVSRSLAPRPALSCVPSSALAVDGCVSAGLGTLLEPARVALGRWSSSEASLHVNLLELRAVVFFDLRDLETVRYALASCRACSPSLCQELLAFLSKVVSRNLWFQVLRVPTALNVVADALSREEPLNTEWTLPQAAFADILRWAGPLEVDMMASPVNHRLPCWVSSFPHPDALAVDCRSIDWNAFGSFYLFPPPAMLPQLLHLILSCRSRRVVVIPWRPHDPWFPPLLQRPDDHLHLLVTPYQ